jgi:hypothetical protein
MPVCKKGRYAPPVHMIKLTQEREIAPTFGYIPATMIGDRTEAAPASPTACIAVDAITVAANPAATGGALRATSA